jgi:hypothetical protein
MDDGENRCSISMQHHEIRVGMVWMRTTGSPLAAVRRRCDGVHALRQTSSESAVDGFEAKAGGVEKHAPAVLRGDTSEGADRGAVGWDRLRCSASPGEWSYVAAAAGEWPQNATQPTARQRRYLACRHNKRCRQTVAVHVQHSPMAR